MSPRLHFAIEAAYEAGRSTLAWFQNGAAVNFKEDQTPVTIADLNAERYIREKLADSYPYEAVWGEEEGESSSTNTRWLIDPIDGTKSFICGVPLYATLLSYEVDSRPVLGVAYFPALDWLLYAEKGSGAFANGRRISVSNKSDLAQSVICSAGFSGLGASGRINGLMNLASTCLASRTWCDAYGHALVASGRVEAMIDPIVKPYDISALDVIVTEAGGACTSFDSKDHPRTEAVSTNKWLHDQILHEFQ